MMDDILKKLQTIQNRLDEVFGDSCLYNYDFRSADFDVLLEAIDKFMVEKNRQDNIREQVCKLVEYDFKDYCDKFIFNKIIPMSEYYDYFVEQFRIKSYNNYYYVWFNGGFNEKFIFDVEGNLLCRGEYVCDEDDENFFVIDYDRKKFMSRMLHYQFNGSKMEVVKLIEGVENVDYSEFFDNDRLIVCSCGDDKLLYDYKDAVVLIPSYSEIYSDYKLFNIFRVEKNVYVVDNYKSKIACKLEFLVGRTGYIYNDKLWDFETGDVFSLKEGNTQEEMLNFVYEDVKNNYLPFRESINKKVRKK